MGTHLSYRSQHFLAYNQHRDAYPSMLIIFMGLFDSDLQVNNPQLLAQSQC